MNNASPIIEMHLRSLFCQGHHQDRERDKHTAYDKQIYQIVDLAVRLIPPYCDTPSEEWSRIQSTTVLIVTSKAVPQGAPEVCQFHCLREVAQAPVCRQGQDPRDTVGHLRRLLKCDYNRHIQRKCYCNKSDKQKDCDWPVYSCFHFLIHYNCSSFLLDIVICATEIATITMKNTTAFAL